jgi:hypothetical protein
MAGVHFEFQRPLAEPLRRGPFREVAFQGEKMFVDGDLEASETENRWRRSNGELYSGMDFLTRVDVHFVDAHGTRSRVLGPHLKFSVMDGVAYAGGHVFAFSDRQNQDWYSLELGRHFAKMVLVVAQT